jgi:hypothetical protein
MAWKRITKNEVSWRAILYINAFKCKGKLLIDDRFLEGHGA